MFVTFRKWKTEVENQTGLKIKSLISDNGGEYSSDEFKSYCAEYGIRMIKTIPETPQQNGVAERMNITLNERAKSMRLHAGLPKMFWADAVSTAAYLINRGPSVPLGFKIPEEEWQGKEVSFHTCECLGVFPMCVLKILTETSLILKRRSVSSLVMAQMIWVIVSGMNK